MKKGGSRGGGGYRVVSDMTGIESSDFQIDKFITLVKSCQVSMSCTTCFNDLTSLMPTS